jgi:hypothetical protein
LLFFPTRSVKHVRVETPNEIEISHGRVLQQLHRSRIAMGPSASSIGQGRAD